MPDPKPVAQRRRAAHAEIPRKPLRLSRGEESAIPRKHGELAIDPVVHINRRVTSFDLYAPARKFSRALAAAAIRAKKFALGREEFYMTLAGIENDDFPVGSYGHRANRAEPVTRGISCRVAPD
jgi:hypothetical protein